MLHLLNILAQATTAASQPTSQAAAALTAARDAAAASLATARDAVAEAKDAAEKTTTLWHVDWMRWITFYNWQIGLTSVATLLIFIIAYVALTRIFGKFLQRHQLRRATAIGAAATTIYVFLWVGHMYRMVDPFDIFAVAVHKVFAALLCLVAIRYLDRLLILPVLTRISGGPPSRFIHQIVVSVLSIFVIAGYCSWAFGVELGSLVAGSAVVSIVIGLALQETLGNFFSGMVLQASVPFQPGDWIQIGDTEGRVLEMTWRAVTLLTNANNYVLIPNSSVAKEKIINYHSPTVATSVGVSVGLDYTIPPNDAKHVLIQAARDTLGVNANPEPSAALVSFDDSAITYKVFFWIAEPQKHGAIEQMVRTNIWYRLNQAGYGIPFPIRTVEFASSEETRRPPAGIQRRPPRRHQKEPPLLRTRPRSPGTARRRNPRLRPRRWTDLLPPGRHRRLPLRPPVRQRHDHLPRRRRPRIRHHHPRRPQRLR